MSNRRRNGAAIALAVSALVAGMAGCGGSDEPPTRFLLLSCDTLRADRLGLYGYDQPVSPRLDALAADGAVFEHAYSTAPMTQPSVSSLMTGRPPEHIGVARGNLRRLPPEVETLAERLAGEGVATAAVISNWVLRRSELKDGQVEGVAQGFAHFDDRMEVREKNREAFERLAPDTTDAAIAWLESADLERSFFLWVHYQDPHGPYTPPRKLAKRFATGASTGASTGATGETPLEIGDTVLGRGRIPNYQALDGERRPSVYRDLYDAEIAYFDRELGRLLDWLDERDLLDGSYVLFTSDHGESLGEHDYWFCHGENVHREQVHVPLVLRAPAGDRPEAPRGRVDAVASLIDVWPTVMDAFGLNPGATPGRSLLTPLPPERVVGQSLVPRGDRTRWWAVSDGRYRVLWNDEDETPRLFDVRADPGEQDDLADRDPERVQRMLVDWQRTMAAGADGAVELGSAIGADGDAEALEKLRKLGYLDADEDPGQ